MAFYLEGGYFSIFFNMPRIKTGYDCVHTIGSCRVFKKTLLFPLVAIIVVALGLFLYPKGQAAEPNNVRQQKFFVIFSYPLGQWSEGIVTGLSRYLQKTSVPFELKQYVYDSPLYAEKPAEEIKAEVEKILKLAHDYKPDFIIVCDDEGADLLIPALKTQKTPLLFAGINKEKQDLPWLAGDAELTGVFERYPIEVSLKLLTN